MEKTISYRISIKNLFDSPTFSVQFHPKHLNKIKKAIRALFRGAFRVERLKDGSYRITIRSGKGYDEKVRALFERFHDAAHRVGL